jgi:leucyl/phenylalanyl-tRNA--protein transferase
MEGQVSETSNKTWITDDMLQAYVRMHDAGHAHSIEVWHEQIMVGGLYGVSVGGVFCGESMFHSKTDASKIAFLALVRHMQAFDMGFIDCQMETPHLASLGCKTIARDEFITRLKEQKGRQFPSDVWRPQSFGNLV